MRLARSYIAPVSSLLRFAELQRTATSTFTSTFTFTFAARGRLRPLCSNCCAAKKHSPRSPIYSERGAISAQPLRSTHTTTTRSKTSSNMASSPTEEFPRNPFSEAVVSAMRKLYPESHADHSFDNTGLILEAPQNSSSSTSGLVLLTNDLTQRVADEAIARKASIIVSYHTIIFRPIKSLTSANTQQATLLRLAAAGISVYCPHTAVDASPFGNADWLIDIATARLPSPAGPAIVPLGHVDGGPRLLHYPAGFNPATSTSISTSTSTSSDKHDGEGREILDAAATTAHSGIKLAVHPHTRKPIVPHADASESAKGVGYGRYAQLDEYTPLTSILARIQAYLRVPASGIALAIPQGKMLNEIDIKSIATCGGSGGGIFMNMGLAPAEKADLWITGEVAHHEALYAIENGICVVCLHHSNSERGYLGAVMKPRLEEELKSRGDQAAAGKVELSVEDRDPFGVFTLNAYPSP